MSFGMPVLAARRRGGGGGAFIDELKLLLDFEGTNGSTTFIDQSSSAHEVLSLRGTPVISTAWSGSGSSSLLIDADEGLNFADSPDFAFGSNPFAVGVRFRMTSFDGSYDWLIGQRDGVRTDSDYWSIMVLANGKVEAQFKLSDGSTLTVDGGAVAIDTDYDVIVSRNASGKFRLHLNGVMVGSDTSALAISDPARNLTIGYSGTGSLDPDFRGYKDTIFIVNGLNPFDTDGAVSYPDPADFQASPSITGNPTVVTDTGFHGEGDTATATAAPHSVLGTLSWQWLRDGTPISGATSASYTYSASDVGSVVRVQQKVTNVNGTASALSAAQTIVTPTYQTDTRIAGTDTRIAGADTRVIQTRIA